MSDPDSISWTNRYLLASILREENEEVQAILQDFTPSDTIDGFNATLLHVAADCGNTTITKYLIDRGYEVDAVDGYGNTSLMLAVMKDRTDVIYELLQANAKVLIANQQGESPAAMIFNDRIVSISMLDAFLKKVKEECSNDSLLTAEELIKAHCPLPRAVRLKDTMITKYMLERDDKEKVNEKDIGGPMLTALHRAVISSDIANVELLIKYGADVNVKNRTGRRPLNFVTHKGILKILLDNGAQLITDNNTLVNGSLFRNFDKETVEMLIEYCSDFSATTAESKSTLFHCLVTNVNFDPVEILKEKFDSTMDINQRSHLGSTLLMSASASANADTVEFLLQKGAEVNIANGDGYTALFYALIPKNMNISKQQMKIVMLLLEYGANVQFINRNISYIRNSNCTLFDFIVLNKTFELSKLLLTHLAMVDLHGNKIEDLILNKINSNEMLNNYYSDIKKKIEKLKETEIWESITLFELLTADKQNIIRLAHNRELISILQ